MTGAPDSSLGFWGKCRICAHCWIVAYYPLDLGRFSSLVRGARCPKCGDKRPVVAKQENGVLLEAADAG